MPESSDNIEKIIGEITVKDSKTLCREVMSIGDTMDVLRSKWTVEILTAILCGSTRFKDILASVHGLSEKGPDHAAVANATRQAARKVRMLRLPAPR